MRSSPHRRNILHRRLPALLVALLLVASSLSVVAQIRRKQRGPRAVAVLEWTNTGPRLVPVTILVDGRYYDAGLYQARPVPMAVEPETVYDVQKEGESLGLFTITEARQAPDAAWYAAGEFKSKDALASAPKAAELPVRSDPEEGPPILRKPKSSESAPPDKPAEAPPAPEQTGAKTPNPPPASTNPPAQSQTSPPAQPGDSAAHTVGEASTPDASGRPVLRRGRPGADSQAAHLPEPGAQAGAKTAPPTPPPGAGRMQVAISDASAQETRSFAWQLKAEERTKLESELQKMALAAAQSFASKRNQTSPAGRFDDAQLRAFDLDFSNEPTFVFTVRIPAAPQAPPPASTLPRRGRGNTVRAKAAEPRQQSTTSPGAFAGKPLERYVTVIARQEIYGDLRRIFSWVTDSHHLDAFPRLEFIDAVDAQGDNRGELLFREVSDQGRAFVLYRVTPDSVSELFNGGQPLQ